MQHPEEMMHEMQEAGLDDIMAEDQLVGMRGGDGDVEAIALPEGAGPIPARLPVTPFPWWFFRASGLYEWKFQFLFIPQPIPWPIPIPDPGPIQPGRAEQAAEGQQAAFTPFWFQREELRLDIDGRYPLMQVSGTLYSGFALRVHWIANLTKTGINTYTGTIWFKDGNTSSLPQTNVTVQVTKSWFTSQRKVTVTFTGGGASNRVRTYKWKSSAFHPVEFEYDVVQGTSAVTQINTGDHPTRPAGLPIENLSIETCFRRAGFNVKMSGGNNVIPLNQAGPDALWTDMEMHDAMQVYWSRFANKAQWSMWTLFAWQHAPVPSQGITPTNLGGIMFDDIGPNHRQGTAIFNGSFIQNAPGGDASPTAWVKRMKFWTACHEMGHAFNLAHSWQKSHPPSWGTPWIPLSNETEARSFMNYPYNVSGGQHAFFSDFEYRFSDGELLFMRHAPERFVQQGNADWFDDHGFQQANVSPVPSFNLDLRVHRALKYFEFMEPVVVELKLTNTTDQPVIVSESILMATEEMTVIIKKRNDTARQWQPLAKYFYHADKQALAPGESVYGSLYLATGLNGWQLSEPGVYTVQVALSVGEEDIVSNPLPIRIAPPRSYDEEFVAQDFFSEDVGRVLSFNGSRYLESANDTLREVVEQFGDKRVAHHAQLALGNPLTKGYKLLKVEGNGQAAVMGEAAEKEFKVLQAKPDEAVKTLNKALLDKPDEAADTLGHIDYRQMVEQYSAFLAKEGDPSAAASSLQKAGKTLKARNVLGSVVEDMEQQRKAYTSQKTSKKTQKKSNK